MLMCTREFVCMCYDCASVCARVFVCIRLFVPLCVFLSFVYCCCTCLCLCLLLCMLLLLMCCTMAHPYIGLYHLTDVGRYRVNHACLEIPGASVPMCGAI